MLLQSRASPFCEQDNRIRRQPLATGGVVFDKRTLHGTGLLLVKACHSYKKDPQASATQVWAGRRNIGAREFVRWRRRAGGDGSERHRQTDDRTPTPRWPRVASMSCLTLGEREFRLSHFFGIVQRAVGTPAKAEERPYCSTSALTRPREATARPGQNRSAGRSGKSLELISLLNSSPGWYLGNSQRVKPLTYNINNTRPLPVHLPLPFHPYDAPRLPAVISILPPAAQQASSPSSLELDRAQAGEEGPAGPEPVGHVWWCVS